MSLPRLQMIAFDELVRLLRRHVHGRMDPNVEHGGYTCKTCGRSCSTFRLPVTIANPKTVTQGVPIPICFACGAEPDTMAGLPPLQYAGYFLENGRKPDFEILERSVANFHRPAKSG